jgi:hypothetical protein
MLALVSSGFTECVRLLGGSTEWYWEPHNGANGAVALTALMVLVMLARRRANILLQSSLQEEYPNGLLEWLHNTWGVGTALPRVRMPGVSADCRLVPVPVPVSVQVPVQVPVPASVWGVSASVSASVSAGMVR